MLAAVEKLDRSVPDSELSEVESYAKASAATDFAWPLMRLLIVRRRFDSAVEVAVGSLAKADNREYAMWKWWEHNFGDRKDYPELSRELGHAYLRLYSRSSPSERDVIADIFGRKNLSVAEFKTLVEGAR